MPQVVGTHITGIGGGSPMDAAKAAALLMSAPDEGESYLYETGHSSEHLPVICVPTTCGTGSEATPVSVLSRPALHAKGSIPYKIWPCAGLSDVRYLKRASASLICVTSMDALSHLFESYVNSRATEHSRAVALCGLSVWRQTKEVLRACAGGELSGEELKDSDAELLMKASSIAGMAISETSTSLPHGLSYTLTAELGTPHGAAVGYFLAGYMRQAGEDGRAALAEAGFESARELDSFYRLVCDVPDVPDSVTAMAAEAMLGSPDKLVRCPFPVDRDILRSFASGRGI